eukprot:Hpha_TRINITY_DN16259_c2_g9::TRINITY_DN16259_c2_g9_i1::g.16440::m.16440
MKRALPMAVLWTTCCAGDPPNLMNAGGHPYWISNPPGSTKDWVGTPGTYSTDFESNHGKVEHFDVYGEVHTKYSQVYWTRNAPINLPPALVERFAGKVMVITGYEVDQVTHSGPQINSTTKGNTLGGFACYPDCSEGDQSVPLYNAYNHHYFGWLVGKDAEVYDRDDWVDDPFPTQTGVRDLPNSHGYPTNIVFKENPGGEYRKSYHGYPGASAEQQKSGFQGYGQFLHSPTQWLVEPMQIDTHNRLTGNVTEQTGHKPWFLPKRDSNGSVTDLTSGLSPLIECPCSDRITRKIVRTSKLITSGTCDASKPQITSLQSCTQFAQASVSTAGSVLSSSKQVNDTSQPYGCILVPDAGKVGSYSAVFNTFKPAPTLPQRTCGSASAGAKAMYGSNDLGSLTNLTISHDGATATITLSGPDGDWFGVGFNATAMADHPYAIIVDGLGKVQERTLGPHAPGNVLPASITVQSSKATGGTRTVVMTRSVAGASSTHYSIPVTPGSINVITAIGNTPQLAYHKARTLASITLLPTNAPSCMCSPVSTAYMTYMNSSTAGFNVDCLDEPRSDMLRHGDGTGRNVANAACNVETYHGGLKCCSHTFFLTDLAQNAEKTPTDVYFLKWRYYFQEYVPPTYNENNVVVTPASHLHLHHWVFLIDANVNDYEEDNAHYGHQSIGTISAHLTGRDMGLEDVPGNYSGLTFYVMTPHCHAPNCIREEIWNADTNEIICNVTAGYGEPQYGPLSMPFNEANYIAIPPCIFGSQPGLQKPWTLTADTKIRAVKYFNNTFRHLGQMAQWTGLMKYDTDPY